MIRVLRIVGLKSVVEFEVDSNRLISSTVVNPVPWTQ
jgi:hypothetical protein